MNKLQKYFEYRCEKGLIKRGLKGNKVYEKRLNYEKEVITNMGFFGYFCIVSDIVTWAINNGIPVGPGRGSAAGSLVAYLLEITHIDPIKYDLIFERFLNPDRINYPDIDLDFSREQRHRVIEYIINKYGEDKVCHIGTFNTIKAKGAIRDVARVRNHPYALGDKLAKLTLDPIHGKPQSLETCYEQIAELRNIKNNPDSDEFDILSWAEKFEDRIRNLGVHPSGILISNEPLTNIVPLYRNKEGQATTLFDMNNVEELGLIKFDILGLDALDTIDRCLKLIKENHNKTIDINKIPIDDPEVFKLLQQGNTAAIFQLEGSSGFRDLLVRIKPTKIEDLGLLVSIYRPGPLSTAQFQHFLKVRAGDAYPDYIVPELKPILSETDGLMVYQEQIMKICTDLAGYTMAEADLMRKAIGKKIQSEMDKHKNKLIQGMVNNKNISELNAKEIFNDIVGFASYSFNKSHAISYASISYQMAWLKAHYPIELMCSAMISDGGDVDKIIQYISECRRLGIKILPPSINKSEYSFSIDKENQAIRFGLGVIKNLGAPVKHIVKEREKKGKFKNIIDFTKRVDLSKVNKLKLQSLVLSGCFDETNKNRAALLTAIDEIWNHKELHKRYESKLKTYKTKIKTYNEREKAIELYNQLTKEQRKSAGKKPGKMKKPIKPDLPAEPIIPQNIIELQKSEILKQEKELLGFYISGHPLDGLTSSKLSNIEKIKSNIDDEKYHTSILAIPSQIKTITTKSSKKRMAFIVLEDKSGTIEAVVFPKTYGKFKQFMEENTPAIYHGIVESLSTDEEHGIKKVIITSIQPIINDSNESYLYKMIGFNKVDQYKNVLLNFKNEDINIKGNIKLTIDILSPDKKYSFRMKNIDLNGDVEEFQNRLKDIK